MHHLPIFAVTGRALWFVVRNLFTLIRLTWLPLVVLIGTEWVIAYWFAWQFPAGTTVKMLADNDDFFLVSMATSVFEALALAVVAVRVHRIILFNDRRPGEYFAFPFGRTEFLYVLMGALSFLALIFAVVAIFTVAALFGGLPDVDNEANPFADMARSGNVAVIAMLIVSYFLVIWISLRLMVWPPAVVANKRLSLGEAWSLTKGKAWAMLGLAIFSSFAIFVPIATVAYWAATSPALVKIKNAEDFHAMLPFAPFDEKAAIALAHPMHIPDPNALLLELAANFLFTTYTIAVLSYAYKALKGYDAHEPIDASGEIDHSDLEEDAVPAH